MNCQGFRDFSSNGPDVSPRRGSSVFDQYLIPLDPEPTTPQTSQPMATPKYESTLYQRMTEITTPGARGGGEPSYSTPDVSPRRSSSVFDQYLIPLDPEPTTPQTRQPMATPKYESEFLQKSAGITTPGARGGGQPSYSTPDVSPRRSSSVFDQYLIPQDSEPTTPQTSQPMATPKYDSQFFQKSAGITTPGARGGGQPSYSTPDVSPRRSSSVFDQYLIPQDSEPTTPQTSQPMATPKYDSAFFQKSAEVTIPAARGGGQLSNKDPDANTRRRPSVFDAWVPPDRQPKTPQASQRMATPRFDSGYSLESAGITIPGARGGGQPSFRAPRPTGTPLISAQQPPRASIPFMDRAIIDPRRHNPPPFASKIVPPRQDLRVLMRADPRYPNPNDPPPKDNYFNNDKIVKLNYNNFTEFLSRRDATLVTFYTPGDCKTNILGKVMSEAACATKRANHAYATVNCCESKFLCEDNDVTKLPAVRIYYRKKCLGEVKNPLMFNAQKARELVERAPNFDCQTLSRIY